MILVGNKNDLWQDRKVVTDKACQVGISNIETETHHQPQTDIENEFDGGETENKVNPFFYLKEAEAAGYANFFEITVRESLDQVRVVFNEGIRRGLASGEHRYENE